MVKCCYAECHVCSVSIMLSDKNKDIMWNVTMLNIIMRSVIMLNVIMRGVIMQNVVVPTFGILGISEIG